MEVIHEASDSLDVNTLKRGDVFKFASEGGGPVVSEEDGTKTRLKGPFMRTWSATDDKRVAVCLVTGYRFNLGDYIFSSRALVLNAKLYLPIETPGARVGPWRRKVVDEQTRLGRELTLDELLALAKDYKMTPEEVEAQRQSWMRQTMD